MRRAIRKNLRDFLAILGLLAIGVGASAYILSNQRLRFPLIEEQPFLVRVELPDAHAVTPGQGQTVRIAGVRVGDIGAVELDEGRAVVELELERRYEGLIRADASALLRTKTGSKDMFVEVDPGEGRALRDGERITIENTAPDVDPDEILAALDDDTRDYLKLLVSGAGKGLDGRGGDLRETLKRLEPIHRDVARVTEAVARRRANMRRLVNRYGLLTEQLGRKDREIVRLVRGSDATFRALASEDEGIASFVSKLPGALRRTQTTLGKVDTLAQRMRPALESLRPPLRRLDEANAAVRPFVREAAPILERQVRPFARAAQPFQRDLGAASRDLVEAGPDLTRSFAGFNRLFDIGAYNPGGSEGIGDGCEREGACSRDERARNEGYLYWLAWLGQNTNSLFSTADGLGPFRRAYLLGLNCGIVESEADQLGLLPEQVQPLTELLSGTGVCAQ